GPHAPRSSRRLSDHGGRWATLRRRDDAGSVCSHGASTYFDLRPAAVPIVRLGPIALSHSGTSAPAPRSAKLFRRSAPLTTHGRRSSSARASRVQGLQHEVAPRDVLLLEDDPAPEGQVGPQARPCDDVVLFTVAVEETVARPAIVCELGLRIRPLAR